MGWVGAECSGSNKAGSSRSMGSSDLAYDNAGSCKEPDWQSVQREQEKLVLRLPDGQKGRFIIHKGHLDEESEFIQGPSPLCPPPSQLWNSFPGEARLVQPLLSF